MSQEAIAGVLFFLFVLLVVAAPIAMIIAGRVNEQKSFEDIARRERMHASFPVVDISIPPDGYEGQNGQLVMGQVVIASDYLKNLFSQYRMIFGGEMKSYQSMMTRAKAESRLRMIEQARALGASSVINVRFETSQIGNTRNPQSAGMSEVLCYGTAIIK